MILKTMQTILVYLIILVCIGLVVKSLVKILKKSSGPSNPCAGCSEHCALYDLKRKDCTDKPEKSK
jgi:hypothetical protein